MADATVRVDVLRISGREVRNTSGGMVGLLTGGSPQVAVGDADGEPLLRIDKRLLDPWFARRPSGEAILRIDNSLSRYHNVTYADGRTGRFDATPKLGTWELLVGGRLTVHARSFGLARFEWECAQDGSLSLLDFLATVVTYREVLTLRRQHAQAAQALS